MRIHGTPQVIEKACFILAYHGEQVHIQEYVVTASLPGTRSKNNKVI